jgi:proteasome accessory factor B
VTSAKLQRWTDVLVALLRYQFGATFTQLSDDVPAYRLTKRATKKEKETVKRMFERDKAELLAFGVPIETIARDGEIEKYRLRPADFYLPYLAVMQSGRKVSPKRVDRDGYHSVQELAFEPDEIAAIGAAAERVQKLGDALLAEQARSAVRKLAFDVPGIADHDHDDVVVRAERIDSAVLPALEESLLSRKRLTFVYRSMSGDSTKKRTVEPLGMFFLNSHWYLAAHEPAASAIKNFRVSRMRDLAVNKARPQTADFALPAGFDLRTHATSRLAWELGDTDSAEAVVEFTTQTGAASPWLQLGTEVPGHRNRRSFRVKSVDRFIRWILSFAGAAKPVSPLAVTDAFRETARETLALYETQR